MAEAFGSKSVALQPYQYQQLQKNTIRLIELEAVKDDETLRCRMSVHNCVPHCYSGRDEDDDPIKFVAPYITLSYAWGESYPDGSHLTHELICDGGLIRITATLDQALRRILSCDWQPLSRRYLLWVDAICISQADLDERSVQVRIMHRIFQCARRLIVWLGEFTPGEQGRSERQILRCYSQLYLDQPNDAPADVDTIHAVTSLAKRPWHNRRWVIQEFVIGHDKTRHFLCGDTIIDWKEFLIMMDSMELAHYVLTLRLFQRNRSRKRSFRSDSAQPTIPILHLLQLHGAAQCSDPRDRLYAVRGLALSPAWMIVDYKLPIHEVYRNFGCSLIADNPKHAYALLACATARQGTTHEDGLPSWIPDWTLDSPVYHSPEHRTCVYFSSVCNYLSQVNAHFSIVVQHEKFLVTEGYVISPCFPPAHLETESGTQCRSCLLFAKSWTQKGPSSVWSSELKKCLESATVEQKILFVTAPRNPAFVLSRTSVLSGYKMTYKAIHCFYLTGKTSCISFPFSGIESVWLA